MGVRGVGLRSGSSLVPLGMQKRTNTSLPSPFNRHIPSASNDHLLSSILALARPHDPPHPLHHKQNNDLPRENQQSPLILLHNLHPHFQMSQKSPYTPTTFLHILQYPFRILFHFSSIMSYPNSMSGDHHQMVKGRYTRISDYRIFYRIW
jgi:hypothetical protein